MYSSNPYLLTSVLCFGISAITVVFLGMISVSLSGFYNKFLVDVGPHDSVCRLVSFLSYVFCFFDLL